MIDLLCHLAALLPFEAMQARFMQRALTALVLLAPMTAVLGVQVISFRMAFFSDAISHSAFAGVALGLMAGVHPHLAMPAFGVLVGLAVISVSRHSSLSADTVTGVVFSAVVAFGLAVVSRHNTVARDVQQFLYGDILTVGEADIEWLLILLVFFVVFQILACNRLLYIGLHPVVARAHGVNAALWQYLFAVLLALVVMFSVWGVGVLLVTALLIVPAAAARNFAATAGGMYWWALAISLSSSAAGLMLSARPWMGTATGATIILTACAWFAVSAVWAALRGWRRD